MPSIPVRHVRKRVATHARSIYDTERNMKRALVVIGLFVGLGLAVWLEPTGVVRGRLRGQAFVGGRPSDYWARGLVDPDAKTQKDALSKLASEKEAALPVLIELLDHPQAEVRWQAAELLSPLGDAAAPALERLLDDADPHVRTVAV